jgi:hypothetical protein|eukprot:COSAG02_NODE_34_length_49821_cov_105.420438_28_plen_80_part_00
MKLGWYWATATSAFQHFTSSILIQPSSPCCLLLLHAMGLHADLFGCCCRFYAGRLGYIPVVDRRSSFGCVRSVVCMQEG